MNKAEFLTGKTRVRSGFFGRLVMQVQVFEASFSANGERLDGFPPFSWRDARASDLFELQHLTYGQVNLTVKLPDVPPMPDFELPGADPVKKAKLH